MDEATKATSAPAQELRASLDQLGRRLQQVAGHAQLDAGVRAAQWAEVERELLDLTPRVAEVEGDALDLGHPVLQDAAHWRDLVHEAQLTEERRQGEALVGTLLQDEAEAWRKRSRALTERRQAAACFEALEQATALDREALDLRASEPLTAEDRGPVREAFLRALQAAPPDETTRLAWAGRLVDRTDVVLTSVDDMRPAQAQRHLALVEADLAWHVEEVEGAATPVRPRLRRRLRRVRARRQEQDLQGKLEGRFGARYVARFDRLVLWLILLVLVLLAAELVLRLPVRVLRIFTILDTAACAVFLWEFGYKLALVRGKASWFARHFLIDFLPSIPFGLFLPARVDGVRALRGVRLLRLLRAFGFLARGMDRIMRRYGAILNRNIILYPTREEYAQAARQAPELEPLLHKLQGKLNDRWEELLNDAPPGHKGGVARARIEVLEQARAAGRTRRPVHRRVGAEAAHDLPAEILLDRMGRLTSEAVSAEMGADFTTRVARAVRTLARAPMRWMPVLRKYVPRVARGMDDAEVAAAASRKSAKELRRYHDRWLWFADLYGTITPSQFIDRLGRTMFRGSLRPAYRLVIFGLLYLLFKYLLSIPQTGFWLDVKEFLERVVGTVLYVLGGICIVLLSLGWWLMRLGGQATAFFEQSAQAQYLSLTESIKGRHLERDAAIFDRRIFAPESRLDKAGATATPEERQRRFVDGVRAWLIKAQAGGDARDAFDAMERTVLLYRDGLDGALFTDNDTRTTVQLLGDPALRNFREMSARVSRRERQLLQKLDLGRQRTALGGPYFWFSLVCQAIEQGVARLINGYNRHALPLVELPRASAEEKGRYEAWLRERRVVKKPPHTVRYVTTAFTALHFLDDDPLRDREVQERFGPELLQRLREDRRRLFRRVFGTYPLHTRPRDRRILNLYRTYESWLGGGRALFIPLRFAWATLRQSGRFLYWVGRCIREIRNPQPEAEIDAAAEADYRTAVRKIQRMRGPVNEACLTLRARFDPEYLGLCLPRAERCGLEGAGVDVDLRFLEARPELAQYIDEERARARDDLRRLGRLVEGGLLERAAERIGVDVEHFGAEHLRAVAAAYVGDLQHLRRNLSALEILDEVYTRAATKDPLPAFRLPRPRLYAKFRRYWRMHGKGDRRAAQAAWRATLHNVRGAGDALRTWALLGLDAKRLGELTLAELSRHPERITDQLVTLRAVQTLALIDVLNYREHIFNLGRYEDSQDDPGDLLTPPIEGENGT